MDPILAYNDALPVGDEGSGHRPTVVAMSLHVNPLSLFGDAVGVLAVATNEDFRIFHKVDSWVEAFKVQYVTGDEWRPGTSDLAPVTCLDWHPMFPELVVGDEYGNITTLTHSNGDYIYKWRFFAREDKEVCSVSWSAQGEYLAAAFNSFMVILKRVTETRRNWRDFRVVKVLPLPKGEQTVKFHPFLPYLFLGTKGHGVLKVYSNLTPEMEEGEWKLLLTCSGGKGCIGMYVFATRHEIFSLIATAGSPTNIWNFHPHQRTRTGIQQPKLINACTLYEDQRSRHMIISVAILSKRYLLAGYGNGSIVIYKGRNDRTALGEKYIFNYAMKKHADHRFVRPIPTVPCIISLPNTNEPITGGNYGFVHFWEITNKKDGPVLKQDAEWELRYYKEQQTPIVEKDESQPFSHPLSQQADKSEAGPSSSLTASVQHASKELTEHQELEIIFDELKLIRKFINLEVQQRAPSYQLSTLREEVEAVRRHIEKTQVVLSQLPEASLVESSAPALD